MVGGTNKGDLIVWHVATGQVVTEKKGVSEHPLTSVDWNPTKRDEVAFIDKNGHWSVLKTQTALAGPNESEPVKDKAKAKALSMKAIAARSNIKQYLDEEKARNGALQQQIVMI